MPIPDGQNCENCNFMDLYGPVRFYGHQVTDHDGVQLGYCRESSPQPRNFAQEGNYDVARKSDTDDWCSRWQEVTVITTP